MATFINDGAYLTVGAISYKKEKLVTISKGEDGDLVQLAFDNGQYAQLRFSEHGTDNSQTDIDSFMEFIKGFFSTTGGTGGGGGAASSVDVTNRREVTTINVKATSTASGINSGEQFVLEITTDNTGNKTYAGITSAGRVTTLPTWTSEVSTSKTIPSTSVKINVPANISSVQLLAENNSRDSVVIYNDSENDEILFISKVSPATTSDPIRLLKGGHVVISDYTKEIYGIWDSSNLGFARIEYTEI